MTWRTKLSNKVLRGLPPSDKRYDILDTLAPGLLASVNPGGSITLMLRTRVGAKSPIRRAIGRYPHMSVEEARQIATEWVRLLEKGGDPKEAQRRAREQERKEREVAAALERNTFALIAEKFITRKCKSQRRGRAVERIIRNELVPLWGDRPLADITHRDVREAIERVIERGAATYAHNVLDAARALFSFAVERDLIEHNPCDRIKRRNVIGHKKSRKRHLNDDELRALWRATGRLGYPFGPLYQLLMLTGARLSEVAGARWREIDLRANTWTVPPERFKTDQYHQVPLTADALAVLETLPRFRHGDCLFSTTFGDKPVNGFSKAKERLDRYMLRTLRALARGRGGDPGSVQLEPFVNHDIRRTVRTRLAGLRVPPHIAEQVIGHGRKGIEAVYDIHEYVDEKREALTLWGARLGSIVQPPPPNVVELRAGEGA